MFQNKFRHTKIERNPEIAIRQHFCHKFSPCVFPKQKWHKRQFIYCTNTEYVVQFQNKIYLKKILLLFVLYKKNVCKLIFCICTSYTLNIGDRTHIINSVFINGRFVAKEIFFLLKFVRQLELSTQFVLRTVQGCSIKVYWKLWLQLILKR